MSAIILRGSRRTGRLMAGVAGLMSLGLAGYTAVTEADRVLRFYDGFWMLGGAAILVAAVMPAVWRWRRDRALAVLTLAAAAGCWLPLVLMALRAGMPIAARLRGAVFFNSADVVGVAVPVGVACVWLALRDHTPVGGATGGDPGV